MSQQAEIERKNTGIEDLPLEESAQNEVKGGATTLTKAGCGTLQLTNVNTY